jgi:hypothetical protein
MISPPENTISRALPLHKTLEIGSILDWFKKAVPNPAEKNVTTQIGCHFEEVGEMIATFSSNDHVTDVSLKNAYQAIIGLANIIKERGKLSLKAGCQEDLLDAMCDQAVTLIGSAYMLNFNYVGALEEVNASNWSKFTNGNPIFDKNRKIQKGPDYFKPVLERFVS